MVEAGKLLFAALILGGAYWASQATAGRRIVAYGAAILVLVYALSLGGIYAFGRVPSKGYVSSMTGLFAGVILGILAGILIGRFAVHHSWLYWILVVIVAGVLVWLPPLI